MTVAEVSEGRARVSYRSTRAVRGHLVRLTLKGNHSFRHLQPRAGSRRFILYAFFGLLLHIHLLPVIGGNVDRLGILQSQSEFCQTNPITARSPSYQRPQVTASVDFHEGSP